MLKYGPWFHIAIAGLVIIQCSGIGCQAQDTVQTSQQDSIYQKILELENAVNEMNRIISEKQQEDELEALFKEADRLSMQKEKQEIDVSKKYFSGVRQQQGLNPNISFGMDLFGGFSTSDASSVTEPSDISMATTDSF